MVIGVIEPNLGIYKTTIKIITLILIVYMVSNTFRKAIPFIDPSLLAQSPVPLLLNSGEVQTKTAEFSIILWFDTGDVPPEIWRNKPTPDWKWTYKELQKGHENGAVTLSGHLLINKNEETSLYKWYTTMAQELAKTGGVIYIDERVDQAMDISAYLSKTNAHPAQWVLIDNMLSIAAYQNYFTTSVLAGQDKINIQLLSRGKNTEGRTVLAIPALLKEF
ncbi:MAG TPA: hypothetical protein VFC58_15435 [Desulfosporosinus sp.]|nr:hypothetical protein [Desulfosporosinus sp.]